MAKRQSGSPSSVLRPASPSAAAALPRRPLYPAWSEAENHVADRFARAIVSGRYPNVNQALPDCRRELAHVTPGLQRTEDAIAWKLLCRAYDFGLPRRMQFWTDQEWRLLEPHASALARGECPDTGTAVLRSSGRSSGPGWGCAIPTAPLSEKSSSVPKHWVGRRIRSRLAPRKTSSLTASAGR